MIKMASQADLWYNKALNNVMSGSAANTPDRTHLLRRCIMDTLSPHGQNNKPPFVPSTSGIYKITCIVTDKYYIGSAINLRKRKNTHFGNLRRNQHCNPHMQRAWNKHGEQAFVFEILELVLIPEMLTVREQCWFDKLKPFGNKGFNIAQVAGSTLGVTGRKPSPESIEKTRQANLGQKRSPEEIESMKQGRWVNRLDRSVSPETRAKMSRAHTGSKRPAEAIEKTRMANTGRKHTLESIERMRQAKLGKKASSEARENMSQSHLGKTHKPHSPETREKLRIANIGKPNPMLGRKHTLEAREKISQAKRGKPNANLGQKHAPEWIEKTQKKYIVTAPDGTEYIVHGINQFCRQHNLDVSGLVKVAKGKCKQYKGWKARYSPEVVSPGVEQWQF